MSICGEEKEDEEEGGMRRGWRRGYASSPRQWTRVAPPDTRSRLGRLSRARPVDLPLHPLNRILFSSVSGSEGYSKTCSFMLNAGGESSSETWMGLHQFGRTTMKDVYVLTSIRRLTFSRARRCGPSFRYKLDLILPYNMLHRVYLP